MSDNGGIVRLMHILDKATRKAQRILFSQASIVQSAQNLTEITLAVVVGVSKKKD